MSVTLRKNLTVRKLQVVTVLMNIMLVHSMQDVTATTRHKKIKAYRKSVKKEPTVKTRLLILDLKPFRS